MEKYGKIFLERPYIQKQFNSRLKILEKKIKRKLAVIERIRLIEKVIKEDDRRIERQKSQASCLVEILKPKNKSKENCCEEIDCLDIRAMKEIEKEERNVMAEMTGWDR